MATKKPTSNDSTANAATSSILPSAEDAAKLEANKAAETAAKIEALRAFNAQAALDLAAHFGAERWEKIIKQCERQAMDVAQIESLAGKMLSTRREHHPLNERAALVGAANGFLCAIGSVPSEADEDAYDDALAATASL